MLLTAYLVWRVSCEGVEPGNFRVPRAINSAIKLKKLNLSYNNLSNIPNKIFLELRMHRLEVISFNKNKIKCIGINAFIGLSELHKLDLSDNNLSHIHPDTFNHNYVLSWLSLAGNKLFSINTEVKFIYSKSLNFFDLSKCNIDSIPINTFNDTENISHLNLSYNSISTMNSNMFISLKKLKLLDISYNKLRSLHAETFSELCTPDMCSVLIIVDGNPWNCNCEMQEFYKWSQSHGLSLNVTCGDLPWSLDNFECFRENSDPVLTPSFSTDDEVTDRIEHKLIEEGSTMEETTTSVTREKIQLGNSTDTLVVINIILIFLVLVLVFLVFCQWWKRRKDQNYRTRYLNQEMNHPLQPERENIESETQT